MRQDQYEKIQNLSEKLADVVIQDIDPEGWVGKGKRPAELTKEERGDAYWCRKMAAASLSLLTRVAHLVDVVQKQSSNGQGGAGVTDGEQLLDEEIASAESEAERLLNRLTTQRAKASFDKRVHGKSA